MLGINVSKVRRDWTHASNTSLNRRRYLALLSAVGLIDAAIISLRQMGVIRRLPDLPFHWVNSNRVTTSRKAFSLGLPDAPLGALLYAFNLATASFGGTRASGRPKSLKYVLLTSSVTGALTAVNFLYNMFVRQKRVCPYCLTGAAMNIGSAILAIRNVPAEKHSSRR